MTMLFVWFLAYWTFMSSSKPKSPEIDYEQ